jgi:hypothetical protein
MKDDLALAYSMLYDFKSGKLSTGKEMSDIQIDLICLLGKDLLPGMECSRDFADQLLLKVAAEDTYWNHKTQELIEQYYELREKNKLSAAEKLRSEFAASCPSIWYRKIIESI